ncbi:helix-turn-helix domain-containing protein [Desulfobotulus mexicanus]|uniref:Helix-turn-helix transcriptional regulator n=1 Tax=Desulfobotulus mexicanus TaxID=2586642 RepID=A0A5S5MBX3_9BACT|nr:helix-turn-helix transcriptional regulator [Desulfobotulus mexicanus]TYT73180.1 helix-turn-helix transcriptional regulator [Desulfobotulus mexicanus]
MREKAYDVELLKGEQIKAGRILLGWSQKTLAAKAYLSETAVTRLERKILEKKSTMKLLAHVLVEAGIIFINHEDGTTGVLIKPDADRAEEIEEEED